MCRQVRFTSFGSLKSLDKKNIVIINQISFRQMNSFEKHIHQEHVTRNLCPSLNDTLYINCVTAGQRDTSLSHLSLHKNSMFQIWLETSLCFADIVISIIFSLLLV